MKIAILLFEGFDELDAIAPFEVLRAAAAAGADLQTEMVSLEGAEVVRGQHGLPVGVTGRWDEPADLLLVPGGGWNARSPRGAWGEVQRGLIPGELARWHRQGKLLASVCTGAMLIAASHEIIEGRHATTHHRAIEDLRAAGAKIVQARVVDEGDLITAGGVTSGLDLALWLVERFCGAELAVAVEERLEYQRRGTVWRHVQ